MSCASLWVVIDRKPARGRSDRRRGLIGELAVEVPDRDLGAAGGETLGDGAADPLRTAGDEEANSQVLHARGASELHAIALELHVPRGHQRTE